MPRFTYENADGELLSISTDVPSERTELLQQGWAEETEEQLAEKTAAELREEAKAAGLPTNGTKSDLTKRLAGDGAADTEAPAKS